MPSAPAPDRVSPAVLPSSFVAPAYGGHCFADIPPTVRYWLTRNGSLALAPDVLDELPSRFNTVILFFIDSFGWKLFEQFRERSPFIEFLGRNGVISKITAQFPSTTAAHVTCIHTGLPVAQSGIYEWQYYEPQLDAVIAPLLFSYAGTRGRDNLLQADIAPEMLYPTVTLYDELGKDGVTSYVIQHREYTPSTFSDIVFRGAHTLPYKTLPEALVNLQFILERGDKPSYIFLYFDKLDAIAHEYGPDSLQFRAEAEVFLSVMDRWFLQELRGKLHNTLFVMTADHGQMALDPKTNIYLNTGTEFPRLQPYLRSNRKGQLLPPGGSPRDLFLYIKPECLDNATALLKEMLRGTAEVFKTDALIEAGLFGTPPLGPALLGRLGNLTILPYASQSVWWYEKGKFEQGFRGHHGGLSPDEMEIPLCLCPFP